MVHEIQNRLISVIALLTACLGLSAQNSSQTDSLVRLQNAKSLELLQMQGKDYRKAVDATFLHNGTYLICDTALWNVDEKIINCQGNVQLIQDETILTSESLDYLIDEDLAKFRGPVVQLANKKNNILRTRNLDYNTKDSVAVFSGGASMKDEDGQVIESDGGSYESARKYFTFSGNVNMYTDSTFVKTSVLEYDSDRDLAKFVTDVDFWHEDNMLSAGRGLYDRSRELFFFQRDVHGLSEEQETWSDSLYFYRNTRDVLLLGNAHVQDSVRNVAAMADYMFYQDSLSRVTMRHRAAVALKNEQEKKTDTLYCGADTLVYETIKRCDIPASEVSAAQKRREEIMEDAVTAYRRKTAEEALEAIKNKIAEAEENGEILPGLQYSQYAYLAKKDTDEEDGSASSSASQAPAAPPQAEEPPALPAADSLAVQAPDTTKIGFLRGVGNVKIFKSDMQVLCDSLRYNDLDSVARFFHRPLVWNETVRQYTADSLFVLVRDRKADRASLMSNAFITCKESDKYYDQIKGTDVMAFFGEDNELARFDALGGANALFYLKEEDAVATVNRVQCRMLSATLKNGTVERVYYYEQPNNDAFPVVQLPEKEHTLKGFEWHPDERPKSKDDVTTLSLKPSERSAYKARPRTAFRQTKIYFPGYIDQLYEELEQARIRKNTPRPEEPEETGKPETAPADSVAITAEPVVAPMDSVSVADTISLVRDSLSVLSDSLAVADTLVQEPPHEPTEKELRREARETARKLRIAHRDAVWAAKDAKDAAKAEAKAQRALERKRERTRKQYIRQCKQDAEDAAKLQKYLEKYQKQKARQDERKQKAESAGERASRPGSGRELQTASESE